jgi:putative RNA 2'-phosphotransferase
VDVTHDTDSDEIPDTLYHGTASKNVDLIMRDGLLPMNRNNVHLSETAEGAVEVGKRHSEHITVFTIDTNSLQEDGFSISESGDGVYVVEKVPSEHLSIHTELPSN